MPRTKKQPKSFSSDFSFDQIIKKEKIVTCARWVNRRSGKVPIDFIEVFERCFLPMAKTNIADACFWLYGLLNMLILKSTSPAVCKYGFKKKFSSD
jgi:hypothetical protein